MSRLHNLPREVDALTELVGHCLEAIELLTARVNELSAASELEPLDIEIVNEVDPEQEEVDQEDAELAQAQAELAARQLEHDKKKASRGAQAAPAPRPPPAPAPKPAAQKPSILAKPAAKVAAKPTTPAKKAGK